MPPATRSQAQSKSFGVVRHYNFLPQVDSFRDDVLSGFALPQKAISPKYFYDSRGSELFEAICNLPEYYPTRTELGIMRDSATEIAEQIGPGTLLIEFGSGASTKTKILIEHARPALYVPIDISDSALQGASDTLSGAFPWLNVASICADFTKPLALPEFTGIDLARRVVYFPGSTIGNFERTEALRFLELTRKLLRPKGILIVGVDLKKDRATLEAAYDDSQGVTAAFNLNLLARINRELRGDFQFQRFRHKAFYDEGHGRVEMHLESLVNQFAHVSGKRFDFKPGETIHTEISCKYSVEEFQAMARSAGFRADRVWTDPRRLFSVHAMAAL